MTRHPFPLCLMAGSICLAPAIVRGASTSVFIGSREYQLGSPFDVRIDFGGRAPVGGPQLAALVKDFLVNYPEKRDYWELVNRRLSRRLRAVFPKETRFAVTLALAPDPCFPVHRSSRVEVGPAGGDAESFEFDFPAPFSNRLHGLKVEYEYPPGCPAGAIPDYRYVQQELLLYGAVHDLGRAAERRSAAAYLLARFPVLPELSVALDRETAPRIRAQDRQEGVEPLSADGDCQVRRSDPAEELVFAPAEYCRGLSLPVRPNRRYATPPLATGAGGEPYEAEIRYVAAGFADGIILPQEFVPRAARHGLSPAGSIGAAWRGALLTGGASRTNSPAPASCGVIPRWFPTCEQAGLLGLALPGGPFAAVVPAYLADRLVSLDGTIHRVPESRECRLILFQRAAQPGKAATR